MIFQRHKVKVGCSDGAGARRPGRGPLSIALLLAAVLVFFAASAEAAWETVGNVVRVTKGKPNQVVLDTSSRARVSVEFFDLEVIRVRIAPTGKFERDLSYAIDYSFDRKTPAVTVIQTPREIVVSNAFGTRVVIQRRPFIITVFDQKGERVVAGDPDRPPMFDRATGDVQATKLRRSEVETYYGFGEKAFLGMSRHGEVIVNWNTDTFAYPPGLDPIYQSIPFFHALHDGKAYGLFLNNTFRTYFDMGKTSPGRYVFGAAGGELDYFVFTGGKDRDPRRVLEDYSALTGRSPLPPIWALGNQQSRWSYFPESKVREIARGFRDRRIPADVIYLDIDYMDGYRVFTWNKERFPDPKKMIADLRADGFRTVLIIDPGIKTDPQYGVYDEGRRRGLFVRNPDGSELQMPVWPGSSAFPDFTDPKARDWFGDQYRGHVAEGVAGYWNDMNEPGVFTTVKSERPEIYHHPDKTFPYDTPHAGDGMPGTHRRYHNVYGMLMARSSFEGIRRLAPETRPFVLTRAGFAGIQRYAAVWTGDDYSSWDHLALKIPMLANLSVSGVPFSGADVGGFYGSPSGELYSRWLQAAALTPFLRSHAHTDSPAREMWVYGDDFTRINRSTVELRYRFLPYLYTLFREHERTGAPVMRPLWYEYPADKSTYLVRDQYLVGADLMVAPVIVEGARSRDVYFPRGADWVDWWTGARYEGGRNARIDAPLDRLPLFVRVGAVVPTQSVVQHTGEMPGADVTLNVGVGIAPGRTETGKLFQDSGDGYEYRRSGWREIVVEHRQGRLGIRRFGDFRGQRVRFVEAVGIGAEPREILVDGRRATWKFDEKNKRLTVEIPEDAGEITMVRQ